MKGRGLNLVLTNQADSPLHLAFAGRIKLLNGPHAAPEPQFAQLQSPLSSHVQMSVCVR